MRNEMKVNDYITLERMTAEGYEFGNCMIGIGDFYSACGQIEEANLPNIAASFDPTMLEEALGIDVEVAK